MADPASRVTAIIPCNNLDEAERWWRALGFTCSEGGNFGDYRILSDGEGGEIHLQTAVEGWVVPGRNPLGVYVYTPRVDALFAAATQAIHAPSHKAWGMYEFALNGPDETLVRIGWPTRLRPALG